MITSKDNAQLKTIRKLLAKRRGGLFVAEGEDLVDAAAAHGWEPEILLRAGDDVEPDLLPSSLGSGTRVVGVYRERWAEPHGEVRVYLHGVRDPGNVGAVLRSIHALGDGPVILGPECADPYSPKAVRASMGSIFARPPARASFDDLAGTTVALERGKGVPLSELEAEPPVTLCLGAERTGLPAELNPSITAHIPLRADGPDSLNVAMAATVALYERNRMAGHAA
ncbi:MAG: methyltransferase, TrmH family [Thermoleophilaceae bacterium]|jgi:TrmH family RNA methyltransferase|nr:methyltransferase, TrmH family [Thermoleophilaceae bacterium]